MTKPKAVPPDDPTFCEWIDSVTWRLSRLLQDYSRVRELIKDLRQRGYLNDLGTDHEIAYGYVVRSCDDEKLREYFDAIMKGGNG